MSERGEYRQLTTNPLDLEAYVFGDGESWESAVAPPIGDTPGRVPLEERHAQVHLPDQTVIPMSEYKGWPYVG